LPRTANRTASSTGAKQGARLCRILSDASVDLAAGAEIADAAGLDAALVLLQFVDSR
jgi:hypothetical protein